jgi:hypothetical protein
MIHDMVLGFSNSAIVWGSVCVYGAWVGACCTIVSSYINQRGSVAREGVLSLRMSPLTTVNQREVQSSARWRGAG